MLIGALFTISKRWKQPKSPSRDDSINKIWHTHIVKYYSLKRKAILHATAWMNLEHVVLSEIR